jgi:hypothetical protein
MTVLVLVAVRLSGVRVTHSSFARFFNSANARRHDAAKFGCGGVKLLGVIGATRLECGEPAAEAGELVRRQLGDSFGDLFDSCGRSIAPFGPWF